MWRTFVPNTISNIRIGLDNEICQDDEEEKFQVNYKIILCLPNGCILENSVAIKIQEKGMCLYVTTK